MASFNEEDHKRRTFSRVNPISEDDEIVVSGVSGRFPNASNVQEFSDNLYNKVDMVDDQELRWRHTNPEIPKRMGNIDRLEKFDSSFFGVPHKQAHTMDPQCRMLLEHAYESVIDAGINPKLLRGTRTGVFIGACFSESEKTWFYEKVPAGGVGLTGCARTMLPNRISYTMGLTGPSFLIDTACSSSMYALDLAFNALRNGECDAALVGGANLLLHPHVTLQFVRLGVLADDGFCRPFDENANGYTRSEAICVLFLQRAKEAKRVYGTLVYSKANCDGFKEQGITYPSGKIQQSLLSEFYKEIDIDPSTIHYVEAHATGTFVGDPEECWAIDQVFCKGRDKPLPVGSIKSNIGHSESSSGCCSVAKVLLAYHNDVIPPNIHFTKPRPTIPALTEGRLKVVTDPTPLDGPLCAVNSFGFGGANAHALLRGNIKRKINHGIPNDPLPRLVTWSGRTESACAAIFDEVCKRPLDEEYVALLNNCQNDTIPANLYRSYGVFVHDEGKNALCVSKEIQHHKGFKRPIVFVYSGMGSQWTSMGTSLMQIPVFRDAINECHATLKPRGLDLLQIITSEDPHMFDNILHSFVGIAAIQIGLTDILKELNLVPDFIIGHSVGELGCAYADDCLTRQEMILCAYSRGMASLETKVVFGAMAAVGLGYKKIRAMLPSGVEVACHNGPDSCTISGPAENISKFVKELKSRGIFAKEVPTSNIAYHSKYISEMGPKLLARLHEVITSPKKRSEKWLSTSVPKPKWERPENHFCSAEYQTNNLLSSVLFEETMTLLPENALTIEIAPHGLLQGILKSSMAESVHVSLTQRGNKENINVLFTGLGKIYMNGVDIPIEKMYPPVEFPVSAGTPLISPLIKWDHSEDWYLAKFDTMKEGKSGERICKIGLSDHEFECVSGHVIDGRVLFPATGYLYLVWETLSMMLGIFCVDLRVEFQDVKFLRATAMQKDVEITFTVMVHRGSGEFEISEGNSPVVTGTIKMLDNVELTKLPDVKKTTSDVVLDQRDFYKELRLRGYHYDGEFKSVVESRTDGLAGKIKWNLNFISFMDCMLQLMIIAKDTRNLIIPTGIDRIVINAVQHFQMAKALGHVEKTVFDVKVCNELKIIQAGGIEIQGLRANSIARRKPPGIPVLESYEFIPHLPANKLDVKDACRTLVQIGFENAYALKIKSVELDNDNREPIVQLFHDALGDLPLVASEPMYLTKNECQLSGVHVEDGELSSLTNCTFVIASKCTDCLASVETAVGCLKEKGYLISREDLSTDFTKLSVPPSCKVVCAIPTDTELLVMLQYEKRKVIGTTSVVKISSQDIEYSWIDQVKTAIEKGPVTLVAEKETYSGILGLVNCLRREPIGKLVTCVFIADPKAPAFDPEHPLYESQLALGLAINVYHNGKWGSYRHLVIEPNTDLAREKRHWFVNTTTKGDLSSFKCLQRSPNDATKLQTTPVTVAYSSLNFRDVMLASGKLSDSFLSKKRDFSDCTLGFEYSGVTDDGRRVMGMIEAGAMASKLQADPNLMWEIPDHWTLEEAATVAVVYSTVYYIFFHTITIQQGKKILVHSGTGGVGLAAIRVALHYGLDVFTTVSSQEKREFLLAKFPELQDSHIGYSRDTSFYDMIMLQTKGKGVDYVLNSLAEEKLRTSIKCLGKEGKFLEIGKFDMANDNKIGLFHFLNEVSFHAVLVDNLITEQSPRKLYIKDLVERDMRSGVVVPLKATVFPANEVEQAFRYLATGKHIGKVILKIRDTEFDKESLPINFHPRVYFNPNMTYVIPGGLGGFGLELADWMVVRGCRKLVLSSSRGLSRSYQNYRISLWKGYGAEVVVSTSDITTPGGCLELIQEANKLGPVAGIFNLAVKLRDAIFENQDPEKFAESIAVKATATKYLDEISRRLCPKLEYFVVFSSVSCGRGNAGQTNYGMANSVMERIIEARCEKGYPGTAIQWGAVGEVGLVADMHEDSKIDMEIGGTLQQRISSCLQELDVLLTSKKPVVSCMVVAEKKIFGNGKGNVLEVVMNIMSIRDIKSVSFDTKLSELGMDSLMAVEIKQTLEREFEIFLTALDVRTLTFSKLQALADAKNNDKEDVHLKYAKGDIPQGVDMLMRNFGDETYCEQTLLRLHSQNNKEDGVSGMVLIPGIEGVAGDIYRKLADEMSLPTYMLQLFNTGHMTSPKEIAESVFEEIFETVFKKTEFYYLVGYSFGSFVTLELAKMLEERGMKGHVLIIDGSPEFLKRLTIDQINLAVDNSSQEKAIYDTVLMASLRVIFPGEELKYWNKIEIVGTDWEKRLNKLGEVGENHNIYSPEYTKKILNALVSRINMASNYSSEAPFKINADITLVRATEVSVMDIDEDYGLSSYTKGQVNLKFVEGNHTTMLENPKLLQIINSLDPFLQSERTFVSYVHG